MTATTPPQNPDRLITPLVEPDKVPELPNEKRPADAPSARIPWVLDYQDPPITEENLRRSVEYWVLKNARPAPSGGFDIPIDAHRFARVSSKDRIPYPVPINHFGTMAQVGLRQSDSGEASEASSAGALMKTSVSGFPMGVYGVVRQWVEEAKSPKQVVRHITNLPAWFEAQQVLRGRVKDYFGLHSLLGRGLMFHEEGAWVPEPDVDTFLLADVIEPTVETVLSLHALPTNPSIQRFAMAEALKAEGVAVKDERSKLSRGLLVQSVFLAPLYRNTGLWNHLHVDIVTSVVSSSIWGGTQAWRDVERVATHHRSWWEDWTWQHQSGVAVSDMGEENIKKSRTLDKFPWLQDAIEQAFGAGKLQNRTSRELFIQSVFERMQEETKQALGSMAQSDTREVIRGQERRLRGEFTGTKWRFKKKPAPTPEKKSREKTGERTG